MTTTTNGHGPAASLDAPVSGHRLYKCDGCREHTNPSFVALRQTEVGPAYLCTTCQRLHDASQAADPPPPMLTVDLPAASAHIAAIAGQDAGAITAADIEMLITWARQCRAFEEHIAAVRDQARGQLQRALEFAGLSGYETPAGVAELVEAYTRTTYDRAALDVLCLDDPELEARLAPHRKTTEVKATLRVSGPATMKNVGPAVGGAA